MILPNSPTVSARVCLVLPLAVGQVGPKAAERVIFRWPTAGGLARLGFLGNNGGAVAAILSEIIELQPTKTLSSLSEYVYHNWLLHLKLNSPVRSVISTNEGHITAS